MSALKFKRTLVSVALFVLLLISLLATGWRRVYLLELADVVNLRVAGTEDNSKIVVMGGMTHSGLAVARTTLEKDGKRMIVRVYIVPIDNVNNRGSFRIIVPIRSDVTEVWFGDRAHTRTVASLFNFPVRIPQPNKSGGLIWRKPSSSEAPG
jgi:hypothetical protein